MQSVAHILINPLIFILYPMAFLLLSTLQYNPLRSNNMKLSLKFLGNNNNNEDQHGTQIMTAKLPISIFNHPFISAITSTTTTTTTTATHSASQFSFSLSTNFPSGPSLKLSYSPTSPSSLPFSLSLKSGLGVFGSPQNSPLLFSVNFSLSPSSYNPIPTFFLHFKPQLGHFSLNKTVFSAPPHSPTVSLDNNAEIGKGFVSDGSSSAWQELKLEPCGGRARDHNTHVGYSDDGAIGFVPESEKYALSPGFAVMARTVMAVTKGFMLSFRWGVNFPKNLGLKKPYLTVNKIGLERVVEEVKQSKQSSDTSETDLQLLKGMYLWMTRDLEIVEKENREIKRLLDEMKMGVSTRNHRDGIHGRKLSQPSGESSSNFERWRSKKSGREEDEQKEPNKSQILVSDVESELQKAIKAASS